MAGFRSSSWFSRPSLPKRVIGGFFTFVWPYLSFVYLYLEAPMYFQWYINTDAMHKFFYFAAASHVIGVLLFWKIKTPALKWIVYYVFSQPMILSPLWAVIFSIYAGLKCRL